MHVAERTLLGKRHNNKGVKMFSKSSLSLAVRRALTVLMAVPLMFSIQGCTEGEALATIGAIAIIGGAVAVGVAASNGSGHHHRHPPRRGHWRHAVEATPVEMTEEEKQVEELNSVAMMAARYNISMDAAKVLKASLKNSVESQSLQPVYDLGLSQEDLKNISQSQEITSSGLNNISTKLKLSTDQARVLVQKMMMDAQQSQSAAFAVQ